MDNKLKIALVVATYNQRENLVEMLSTACDSMIDTPHTLDVLVYDHGKRHTATMTQNVLAGAAVHYIASTQGNATGVALSWTNGVALAYGPTYDCDACIITNDDITFGPGDLVKLAEETAKHRVGEVESTTAHPMLGNKVSITPASGLHIVTCRGTQNRPGEPHEDSIGYSCFGITRAGWGELGAFDSNFFPAYFEDCDYERRAKLAGMREVNIGMTGIVHKGSQTIATDAALNEQNHRTFQANQAYYIRKWGGTNGLEVFDRPFNMPIKDVTARGIERAWRIPPGKRFAPYGHPFDRTAEERKELVRL